MNELFDLNSLINIYSFLPHKDKINLAHTNKYLYDIFWSYLEKNITLDTKNEYFINILERKNICIRKLTINLEILDFTILSLVKYISDLKSIKITNISKKVIDFEMFPKSIEEIELGNNTRSDYYYIIFPDYFYINHSNSKKQNEFILDSLKNSVVKILPNLKTLKFYGNIYDYVNLLKIVI